MKFTQLLRKQHIDRAKNWLWYHQRDRTVQVSKAEAILASMNIPVEDANAFAIRSTENLIIKEKFENPFPIKDVNENSKTYLMIGDLYTLQEGVQQASLLTKTVQVEDKLPKKVTDLITDVPCNIDTLVERFVRSSVIYDPEQVKLPKIKDPERPSWVYPRVFGLSSTRKVHNLFKKLLQLCESLSGLSIAQNRFIVSDGLLSTFIEKENRFLNFSTKMDIMMTSMMPLAPIADVNIHNELKMPNIYPLHSTAGLTKSEIYDSTDLYPINKESPLMNVHTIFVNYDPSKVKNLTELPVTENQIHARSLTQSFTTAATYARQRFGKDVKALPEPVVVQCIQSDGQNFYFSVYQLNTLDIDGEEGIRNFWWAEPTIKLYEFAGYKEGQPYLDGYNSDVFKRLLAFYRNN
ncbi:39S ribosomal protein L37, mitochondrial [Ceratina calcarata]|uniref:Large ribosomal subunit protein mL37 n=1 Tax=Ceratina calcarata TaxID=156304 RepID=A0AAJ7SBM7_9HYME|nr:39S ribosomal protein L37, mitochondrial [Ceratina calcarata]XP_026674968.1 39S ribosomal protein L37, mitochondrial [Ceratina calcarata]XP_026674969.1 39S ribosomal protein L37, mitochondrial [Ceratina calcarata]